MHFTLLKIKIKRIHLFDLNKLTQAHKDCVYQEIRDHYASAEQLVQNEETQLNRRYLYWGLLSMKVNS